LTDSYGLHIVLSLHSEHVQTCSILCWLNVPRYCDHSAPVMYSITVCF